MSESMSSPILTKSYFEKCKDITPHYLRLWKINNKLEYRTKWADMASKYRKYHQLLTVKQVANYNKSLKIYRKQHLRRFLHRWQHKQSWVRLSRLLLRKCRNLCFQKIKTIYDSKKHEMYKLPWQRFSKLIIQKNREKQLTEYLQDVWNSRKLRKYLHIWLNMSDKKQCKMRIYWKSMISRYADITQRRGLLQSQQQMKNLKQWYSMYRRYMNLDKLKTLLKEKKLMDLQNKWESFQQRILRRHRLETLIEALHKRQNWRSFALRMIRINKIRYLTKQQKRLVQQRKWDSLIDRARNIMHQRILKTGQILAEQWKAKHESKSILKKYFALFIDKYRKKRLFKKILKRSFNLSIREYCLSFAHSSALIIQTAFRNSSQMYKQKKLREAYNQWKGKYLIYKEAFDTVPQLVQQHEIPAFDINFEQIPFTVPQINDFSKTMNEVMHLRNLKKVVVPGKLLNQSQTKVQLNLSPIHSVNVTKKLEDQNALNDADIGHEIIDLSFKDFSEEENNESDKDTINSRYESIYNDELNNDSLNEQISKLKKDNQLLHDQLDKIHPDTNQSKDIGTIELNIDYDAILPSLNSFSINPLSNLIIKERKSNDNFLSQFVNNLNDQEIIPSLVDISSKPLEHFERTEKPSSKFEDQSSIKESQSSLIEEPSSTLNIPEGSVDQFVLKSKELDPILNTLFDLPINTLSNFSAKQQTEQSVKEIPKRILDKSINTNEYDGILPDLCRINVSQLYSMPVKEIKTVEEEKSNQNVEIPDNFLTQFVNDDYDKILESLVQISQPNIEPKQKEETVQQIPDSIVNNSLQLNEVNSILPTLFDINLNALNNTVPKQHKSDDFIELEEDQNENKEKEIPNSLLTDVVSLNNYDSVLSTLVELDVNPLNEMISGKLQTSEVPVDTPSEQTVEKVIPDDLLQSCLSNEYEDIIPSLINLHLDQLNIPQIISPQQKIPENVLSVGLKSNDLDDVIPKLCSIDISPLKQIQIPEKPQIDEVASNDQIDEVASNDQIDEVASNDQIDTEKEIPDGLVQSCLNDEYDEVVPSLFNLNVNPLTNLYKDSPIQKVEKEIPVSSVNQFIVNQNDFDSLVSSLGNLNNTIDSLKNIEQKIEKRNKKEPNKSTEIPDSILQNSLEIDVPMPTLFDINLNSLNNIEPKEQTDKEIENNQSENEFELDQSEIENKETETIGEKKTETKEDEIEIKDKEIPNSLLNGFLCNDFDSILPLLVPISIQSLNEMTSNKKQYESESESAPNIFNFDEQQKNDEEEELSNIFDFNEPEVKKDSQSEEEETEVKHISLPQSLFDSFELDSIAPTLFKLHTNPLNEFSSTQQPKPTEKVLVESQHDDSLNKLPLANEDDQNASKSPNFDLIDDLNRIESQQKKEEIEQKQLDELPSNIKQQINDQLNIDEAIEQIPQISVDSLSIYEPNVNDLGDDNLDVSKIANLITLDNVYKHIKPYANKVNRLYSFIPKEIPINEKDELNSNINDQNESNVKETNSEINEKEPLNNIREEESQNNEIVSTFEEEFNTDNPIHEIEDNTIHDDEELNKDKSIEEELPNNQKDSSIEEEESHNNEIVSTFEEEEFGKENSIHEIEDDSNLIESLEEELTNEDSFERIEKEIYENEKDESDLIDENEILSLLPSFVDYENSIKDIINNEIESLNSIKFHDLTNQEQEEDDDDEIISSISESIQKPSDFDSTLNSFHFTNVNPLNYFIPKSSIETESNEIDTNEIIDLLPPLLSIPKIVELLTIDTEKVADDSEKVESESETVDDKNLLSDVSNEIGDDMKFNILVPSNHDSKLENLSRLINEPISPQIDIEYDSPKGKLDQAQRINFIVNSEDEESGLPVVDSDFHVSSGINESFEENVDSLNFSQLDNEKEFNDLKVNEEEDLNQKSNQFDLELNDIDINDQNPLETEIDDKQAGETNLIDESFENDNKDDEIIDHLYDDFERLSEEEAINRNEEDIIDNSFENEINDIQDNSVDLVVDANSQNDQDKNEIENNNQFIDNSFEKDVDENDNFEEEMSNQFDESIGNVLPEEHDKNSIDNDVDDQNIVDLNNNEDSENNQFDQSLRESQVYAHNENEENNQNNSIDNDENIKDNVENEEDEQFDEKDLINNDANDIQEENNLPIDNDSNDQNLEDLNKSEDSESSQFYQSLRESQVYAHNENDENNQVDQKDSMNNDSNNMPEENNHDNNDEHLEYLNNSEDSESNQFYQSLRESQVYAHNENEENNQNNSIDNDENIKDNAEQFDDKDSFDNNDLPEENDQDISVDDEIVSMVLDNINIDFDMNATFESIMKNEVKPIKSIRYQIPDDIPIEEEEEFDEYEFNEIFDGNVFNLDDLLGHQIETKIDIIGRFYLNPPETFSIDESSRQIAFENVSSTLQFNDISEPPSETRKTLNNLLPFQTLLNYDTPTPSMSKLESTLDDESVSRSQFSFNNQPKPQRKIEPSTFDLPFEHVDNENEDDVEYDEYEIETPTIDFADYIRYYISREFVPTSLLRMQFKRNTLQNELHNDYNTKEDIEIEEESDDSEDLIYISDDLAQLLVEQAGLDDPINTPIATIQNRIEPFEWYDTDGRNSLGHEYDLNAISRRVTNSLNSNNLLFNAFHQDD